MANNITAKPIEHVPFRDVLASEAQLNASPWCSALSCARYRIPVIHRPSHIVGLTVDELRAAPSRSGEKALFRLLPFELGHFKNIGRKVIDLFCADDFYTRFKDRSVEEITQELKSRYDELYDFAEQEYGKMPLLIGDRSEYLPDYITTITTKMALLEQDPFAIPKNELIFKAILSNPRMRRNLPDQLYLYAHMRGCNDSMMKDYAVWVKKIAGRLDKAAEIRESALD